MLRGKFIGVKCHVSTNYFQKVRGKNTCIYRMRERQTQYHVQGLTFTKMGVPVVAQWLTNPTRNHEVSGSIPALAPCVKDSALR